MKNWYVESIPCCERSIYYENLLPVNFCNSEGTVVRLLNCVSFNEICFDCNLLFSVYCSMFFCAYDSLGRCFQK